MSGSAKFPVGEPPKPWERPDVMVGFEPLTEQSKTILGMLCPDGAEVLGILQTGEQSAVINYRLHGARYEMAVRPWTTVSLP